jgi:hypothetical protein
MLSIRPAQGFCDESAIFWFLFSLFSFGRKEFTALTIMPSISNRPIFNILSLVTPAVEIVAAITFSRLNWPTQGIFMVYFDIYLCLFLSSLGVLFAIVSLVRRERWLLVSLTALFLNSAPLLYALLHRNTQLYGP